MTPTIESELERMVARAAVEQAEQALPGTRDRYTAALTAYREAELTLAKAKLDEAEVLDRQAIEATRNAER